MVVVVVVVVAVVVVVVVLVAVVVVVVVLAAVVAVVVFDVAVVTVADVDTGTGVVEASLAATVAALVVVGVHAPHVAGQMVAQGMLSRAHIDSLWSHWGLSGPRQAGSVVAAVCVVVVASTLVVVVVVEISSGVVVAVRWASVVDTSHLVHVLTHTLAKNSAPKPRASKMPTSLPGQPGVPNGHAMSLRQMDAAWSQLATPLTSNASK